MNVTLKYFAQVRKAAGVESETLDLPDGTGLAAALAEAAARHGDDMKTLVLDDAGAVRPSILVLADGVPLARGAACELKDGCEISVLSAVAGG